jgi:hypothetical protein
MSADNMIVVARINYGKNYNVALMTWPEVEAITNAAKKGIIQFTEFFTFKDAYKEANKLFKKHHTEYGIMPIDLVTDPSKNKERINVFVIIDNDKVRIETVDHAINLINNHSWKQDEKTGNLFIELVGQEADFFRDRFNNYGYGVLYLKDNCIVNMEVLFAP